MASHVTQGSAIAIQGTDGAVRIADDRIAVRGRKQFHGEVLEYRPPGDEVTQLRADLRASLGARTRLRAARPACALGRRLRRLPLSG